jgi:5-methyltetrahydropteroyltriglutamate--homocysteine methyltransferase
MATTQRAHPPFRADHVGSLLRPDELKRAREHYLGAQTPTSNLGPHDNADLRSVEDTCVREALAMQERTGLRAATDGEMRRRSWWLELLLGWDGFAADRTGNSKMPWRNATGVAQASSQLKVVGPIRWRPSSTVRAFEFLRANTSLVPKVGLPAPPTVHFALGGMDNVDRTAYPDEEQLWADLLAAFRQEFDALVAAGATYIQLDDTAFAFLCDPLQRDYAKSWGADPERLLDRYTNAINSIVANRPPSVTVTIHECRGNREGNWAAEGGYEPVAERLFGQLEVDGYFLEYDSVRAGGFEPLRFLSKGKVAALGLVSSKTAKLEDPETVIRRIHEAEKYVSLDQLSLCPQCGFASSIGGNPLTLEEQRTKLESLVTIADRVWGSL